jgi:hypothetical protein
VKKFIAAIAVTLVLLTTGCVPKETPPGGGNGGPPPGNDPNATDVHFEIFAFDETDYELINVYDAVITLHAFGVDENGEPVNANITDYNLGTVVPSPFTYIEIVPTSNWQRFSQDIVGATMTATMFLLPGWRLECSVRSIDHVLLHESSVTNTLTVPFDLPVTCIWP